MGGRTIIAVVAVLYYGIVVCQVLPAATTKAPHEMRLSLGGIRVQGVQSEHVYGPNASFTGLPFWGRSLQVEYARHLNDRRALLFGVTHRSIPVLFAWNLGQDPEWSAFTGISNITETEPAEMCNWYGASMGMEQVVKKGGVFGLVASASVGLSSIWAERAWEVVVPVPNEGLVGLGWYGLRVNVNRDWLPFAEGSISLTKHLKNQNALILRLWITGFLASDHIQGAYVIKPGAVDESAGVFKGSLMHAGFSLGYGMTWGYPKVPRYLR